MADDRRQRIVRYFHDFVRFTKKACPLYAELSPQIAADHELLRLVEHAIERQPPANMLFGAVHFLLLRGADHPLAGFYPTVGSGSGQGDAFEHFRDFCLSHFEELVPLLEVRRVQTNEVRRAALLLPGFVEVARRSQRNLATVEVGAAAGLLTIWDQYQYDYGRAGSTGDRRSPLTLTCEPRGPNSPPAEMPTLSWGAGIDLHPVDLSNGDDADWLRSLIWPNQVERLRRLEAAIEIAKRHPPTLVEGDGIELVEQVAAQAPADAVVVVHHSFALNQVAPQDRARFETNIARLNQQREAYLVAIEWVARQPGPLELRLGVPGEDVLEKTTLARVHEHGEWIEWAA